MIGRLADRRWKPKVEKFNKFAKPKSFVLLDRQQRSARLRTNFFADRLEDSKGPEGLNHVCRVYYIYKLFQLWLLNRFSALTAIYQTCIALLKQQVYVRAAYLGSQGNQEASLFSPVFSTISETICDF